MFSSSNTDILKYLQKSITFVLDCFNEGPIAPLLLIMLNKEIIKNLVEESIYENESIFLVELKVSSSNQIEILIDSLEGISIKNCMSLSRHIENKLDREECDFSLQVASAGLSEPFKVFQQYKKSIGKNVNVFLKGGKKTAR